jgi:D-alanyl-D-alanine carboxypeptidase (penicillin-binding protein 5/6)
MKPSSWSLRALALAVLAVGQAFCVGFGPPRLAAGDFGRAPLWPGQVQELAASARQPQPGAVAALLVDVGTHTVIYSKDATRRVAPASTTKMMTALVAIQSGRLDDTVVIQPGDVEVGSAIGLSPGEQWTLRDLLYDLLLPSDNAAAVAIARHVAGSEAAFVAMMNAQAAEWGLKDTHFANPHGLDDPEHYTTASDLAQIALRGLAQPVFAGIVGTREKEVRGRVLHNLNELLGSYDGAQGIKTGTTDAAGQCLVAAAARPAGRALAVVLGSADRYADARALLDFYFAHYRVVAPGLGPVGLNASRQADGSRAILTLQTQPTILLPLWQVPWLQVVRVGQAGSPAGKARFVAGGRVLAEAPLQAVAP